MRDRSRLTGVLVVAGLIAAGALLVRRRQAAQRHDGPEELDRAVEEGLAASRAVSSTPEPAWIRVDGFQDGVAEDPFPEASEEAVAGAAPVPSA